MRSPYLCLTIVAILGVCCLVGMAGIVFLGYSGKTPPESLVSIVATAVGSLASFLVMPPKGSMGVETPPPSGQHPRIN